MTFRWISSPTLRFAHTRQPHGTVMFHYRLRARSSGLVLLLLLFSMSVASAQSYADLYEFGANNERQFLLRVRVVARRSNYSGRPIRPIRDL